VPSGGQSPIAAAMTLGIDGATVTADFDFRSEGQPTWLIELETESGETLHLAEGGAGLHINGDRLQGGTAESEYHGVYRRFAQLFVARSSELDVAPLQLAADAFLIAHTELTDPFDP
jgi:D-galactose 1-dehydrogenase